jgi:hypothetical protein
MLEQLCEIMPIIEKASPLIALLLQDERIGIIVGLLGLLVNCNPTNTPELVQKLKDDPDLYAKLNNLEKTHAEWLQNL